MKKSGGRSGLYIRSEKLAKKREEAMTAMKDVKVLVVDDNALILDLLMKGLAPHCDAHAAADGADALLKIIDEQPDLVVCDYRMPGLDGRQLYEKLRGRQQTKLFRLFFWPAAATSKKNCAPSSKASRNSSPSRFS